MGFPIMWLPCQGLYIAKTGMAENDGAAPSGHQHYGHMVPFVQFPTGILKG